MALRVLPTVLRRNPGPEYNIKWNDHRGKEWDFGLTSVRRAYPDAFMFGHIEDTGTHGPPSHRFYAVVQVITANHGDSIETTVTSQALAALGVHDQQVDTQRSVNTRDHFGHLIQLIWDETGIRQGMRAYEGSEGFPTEQAAKNYFTQVYKALENGMGRFTVSADGHLTLRR